MVDRLDPREGSESREIFLGPLNPTATCSQGVRLRQKGIATQPRHPAGYKGRPRPIESSRLKKPPKEYSTSPQARGLLSILGIPGGRKLTGTNVISPEWFKKYLRSRPTPRAWAPSHPSPRAWAPSRLTPRARDLSRQTARAWVLSHPTGIHTASNHYGSKSMTPGSNF